MLSVSPIPAFEDNYIWLLRDIDGASAAVVDPGDADPVLAALDAGGFGLGAILITHHHYDHTGGVEDLVAAYPGVRVLGPQDRRISGVTEPVGEGDEVVLSDPAVRIQVLEVPGHTSTHIAYFGEGSLFCGDTLFAAGCGRVFDGTFEQLAVSLERIARLPAATLVYCAHEYTLANLGFADWVEPGSLAIRARTAAVRDLRESGQPSVPSRIADELTTNPFLRVGVPTVKAAAEDYAGGTLTTPADVFTALRHWKDKKYD